MEKGLLGVGFYVFMIRSLGIIPPVGHYKDIRLSWSGPEVRKTHSSIFIIWICILLSLSAYMRSLQTVLFTDFLHLSSFHDKISKQSNMKRYLVEIDIQLNSYYFVVYYKYTLLLRMGYLVRVALSHIKFKK